jgi:urea transport system ATP-binding protein
MLTMENIEVGYGESVIIRDVSIRVKKGQVVCLMGRNGVGKSTLVKSLMGILKTKNGTVKYGEKDITGESSGKRAKLGIGYVPQGREIFGQLSVYENLLLGLEASREQNPQISEAVLDQFPVLRQMFKRKGGDLSGGQQQQLAFARAMVSNPDLFILDEPTEGIQPSIVSDIRDVIRSIKASQTSVLLVEQSLDFVRSVGDYFYVIQKGEVAAEGDISELSDEIVRSYLVV